MSPTIEFAHNLPSTPEHAAAFATILQAMFPAYNRLIVVEEYSRNSFSGSWVFLIQRVDVEKGHLPVVVKLAARSLIEKEWRAYAQHIRGRWPAIAAIKEPPVIGDEGTFAGLYYDMVGEGVFPVTTLGDFCLDETVPPEAVEAILNRFAQVIERAFRFSAARPKTRLGALYETLLPVNLLIAPLPAPTAGSISPIAAANPPLEPPQPDDIVRLTGFVVTKIDIKDRSITLNLPRPGGTGRLPDGSYYVRLMYGQDEPLPAYAIDAPLPPLTGRVLKTRSGQWQEILTAVLDDPAFDLTRPRLSLPDGTTLPNPLLALPHILELRYDLKVDIIHGDLHPGNILVDPEALDLRLIDFAEARRDHLLHDFLRLEMAVMTQLVAPMLAAARLPLETIPRFYEQLHTAAFYADPFSTAHSPDPTLRKPFTLLKTIRALGRRHGLFDPAAYDAYYHCLIIHLMGALKFANLDRLARQTALWGAATLLDLIDAPLSSPPQPGQLLNGRYRIEGLVGIGGMGAVYKGQDLTLARPIAVKVMHPHLTRHTDLRERFLREAQTTAQLNHPGIVQVFDFGQERSLLYIVMEYIPGHNLQQLLQQLRTERRWLRLAEAVHIVHHICQALDYAHRQGVLHRDLKPSNILLKIEPGDSLPYRPVITDLGLAKLLGADGLTLTGLPFGTPAYMSPEQALGRPLEAQSDIYAMGVFLYELIAGRPPFPVTTTAEAAHYHGQVDPPALSTHRPDAPAALVQVVDRALAKDPADRFPDAAAMAQALAGTLEAAAQILTAPPDLAEPVSLTIRSWAAEVASPPPEIEINLPEARPGGKESAGRPLIIKEDRGSGDNNIHGSIYAQEVLIGHNSQMIIHPRPQTEGLAALFAALYRRIEIRPDDPDVERAELRQIVERIEQEAARGRQANLNKLSRWLTNLARLAPDVAGLALTGLAAPDSGAAPSIRRLAIQIRPETGDG